MQQPFAGKIMMLALTVNMLLGFTLQAQQFHFTDINTLTNSNPFNYQFDQHSKFAEYKGYLYFAADDGIHGIELFRSNGTAEGTELVADLVPGNGYSNISDIKVAGDLLYFTVQDGTYRSKLWASDGTPAGTRQVVIDNGLINYQEAIFLTDVNGKLFFFYSYFDNRGSHFLLTSTDATGRAAFSLPAVDGFPYETAVINGRLYFTYFDYKTGGQSEIMVSDGTPAGTYVVADVNNDPSISSAPNHLTAVGNQLYFAANDGTGNKLWVTDDIWYNTHAVRNDFNIIVNQEQTFGVNPFCVSNGVLYFQGSFAKAGLPSTADAALCKYNLNDPLAGVELVKNIIPGSTALLLRNFTDVNGELYFTVKASINGEQLWKSNGMAAGTMLVKDINPGEANFFSNLVNLDGQLLFSYSNSSLGAELWRSNGTANGTVVVKDIYPGKASGFPNWITAYHHTALFSATSASGNELWQSDGTTAGTLQVKDINTTATAGSYPIGFTGLGKTTIFAAVNPQNTQNNLYAFTGSGKAPMVISNEANLRLLFGVSDEAKIFTVYKRHAYFADNNNRLWQTAGTVKSTSLLPLKTFVNNDSGFITNMVATDKYLFVFTINFITNTTAMWSTDGTQAGTRQLKRDFNGFFNLYPVVMGNVLYFTNVDNNRGSELWKSDGTLSGTAVVKTVGSFNYNPLANLCVFNSKLYFSGYTADGAGPLLWQSDGTTPGTKVLSNTTVYPQRFGQANGRLFFYGFNSPETSYELFASDGTAAGTHLIKDINPEPYTSSISYLYPSSIVGGSKTLYFVADDGVHGPDMWKSDGTSAGTVLIKDIVPGFTTFKGAVNIDDHLYYVTYDDSFYKTDGTAAGTELINDPVLQGVSNITYLTAVGNEIYFSGYKYKTGQELYSAAVSTKGNKPANSLLNPDNIIVETPNMQLRLSPNPVKDILQIQLNTKDNIDKNQVTILSAAGIVMNTQSLKSHTTTWSINLSGYKPGVYFVKVDGNGKTNFGRFVKL